MTSTLSSLQQVLSFSPSLLTSPSIQKALGTVMTTSHLPSILDRVIDILLIDVKEFASQTLLIRTILSLALRSENTTVISRAFRFISLVMKELIHTEPIPIQQIVKLEHLTLKYVCHETDATIQQLSFATLGICWEISSIPLHSAIASPLVDSHSSFVPQDVNLYDVLVNALNCPSCQTVIEKEIDELVKNYLDSSEMKLFSFLLDAFRQPLKPELSFIHQLLAEPSNIQGLQLTSHYLQRTIRFDYSSIQKEIESLVPAVDTLEGVKYVAELLVLSDNIDSISEVISDCLKKIQSSLSIRSVLLLGYLYEGLSRSLYVCLLSKSIDLSYHSVIQQLLKHFDSCDNLMQIYLLQSIFQCLTHNPNELSRSLLDLLVQVDMLTFSYLVHHFHKSVSRFISDEHSSPLH